MSGIRVCYSHGDRLAKLANWKCNVGMHTYEYTIRFNSLTANSGYTIAGRAIWNWDEVV